MCWLLVVRLVFWYICGVNWLITPILVLFTNSHCIYDWYF